MSANKIILPSGRTLIVRPGFRVGAERVEQKRGPCPHLGEVLREEDCKTCRGSVRRKVYECAKRGEVTMMDCRRCEDFADPE